MESETCGTCVNDFCSFLIDVSRVIYIIFCALIEILIVMFQDVLENETIKLDKLFILSLIYDIIKVRM